MKTFLHYNLILTKYLRSVKKKGRLNPKMRAWDGGASIFTAFLYSLSAPLLASPKNFRAKPKQAGKKEGGLGEGIKYPNTSCFPFSFISQTTFRERQS